MPSLHEGAPVVAVLDETTRAELRRALGDAADQVAFPDPALVHARATVHRRGPVGAAQPPRPTPTGRATVVGQHVEGLPGCGENHWARLDIALNVAVVGLPITVLCPYRTDDPVLARVEATHPRLVTATGMVSSGSYRPPVEALVEYPPPPPPELGPSAAELSFGAEELGDLRHLVAEVVGRSGAAPDRVADLVLAVTRSGRTASSTGQATAACGCGLPTRPSPRRSQTGVPRTFRSPAWSPRLRSGPGDAGCGWPRSCATSCRCGATPRAPWSGCGWTTRLRSSVRRGSQMGRSPQLPCQLSPGSIVIRPVPEFSASGGQVIGSTATARPRPGWSSGVKTCTQPNAGSAHTSTPPSGPSSRWRTSSSPGRARSRRTRRPASGP